MNDELIKRIDIKQITRNDTVIIYCKTNDPEVIHDTCDEICSILEDYDTKKIICSRILVLPSIIDRLIITSVPKDDEYQFLIAIANSECTCPEGSFDSDNLCLRCKASHILNDVSEIIQEGYKELKGE